MKRTLTIRVTDELYERICDEAKIKSLTISSLVSLLISKQLQGNSPTISLPEVCIQDRVTIILRGKDAAKLRQMAGRLGLSPTVFIRNILLNQDMKVITVNVGNTDELLDLVSNCDLEVMAFINTIKEFPDSPLNIKIAEEINAILISLRDEFKKFHEELSRTKRAVGNDIRRRMDKYGN